MNSRFLKKLKEKGIVNIKVKDPAGYIVKQRYNVKKSKSRVVVIRVLKKYHIVMQL